MHGLVSMSDVDSIVQELECAGDLEVLEAQQEVLQSSEVRSIRINVTLRFHHQEKLVIVRRLTEATSRRPNVAETWTSDRFPRNTHGVWPTDVICRRSAEVVRLPEGVVEVGRLLNERQVDRRHRHVDTLRHNVEQEAELIGIAPINRLQDILGSYPMPELIRNRRIVILLPDEVGGDVEGLRRMRQWIWTKIGLDVDTVIRLRLRRIREGGGDANDDDQCNARN